MNEYNRISLTHFIATISKAFGIEPPANSAPPLDWVCDVLDDFCKDGFDRLLIHNPDGVGMWLYRKYPEVFAPVMKHTQITIPFQSVMPTVTPVNFGTMYTGATPDVHGIKKYEKPIIQIDTFFDALARAGKKVALVSEETASMSNIFLGKGIDIYNCSCESEIVEKAQELIHKDEYDVICVYTYMYDTLDHIYGPETKETISAMNNQAMIFDCLVSTVKRCWTEHNTLFCFSPDHGVHKILNGTELYKNGSIKKGGHGSDSPLDKNILHYIGVALRHIEIDPVIE